MTLPIDSKSRKAIPLTTGCLDYFPDALAAVAEVSRSGNDKHNPGEPLHWSRGKSNDHADCIARHLLERGLLDTEDGLRHSAKLAWRALALLQLEIERDRSGKDEVQWNAIPPNCRACGIPIPADSDRAWCDQCWRKRGGIVT